MLANAQAVTWNVVTWNVVTNLHHGKMLCTVMSLEESISCPALDQDTAKRPEIDRVIPACRYN